MRLQIVPMSWEWDRILFGLKRHPSQKVIFVCPMLKKGGEVDEVSKRTLEVARKLNEKIKFLMETELIFADYYDLKSCLSTMKAIFDRHTKKYDEIFINISGGNKIIAAAAIIVSQFYPAKLFYIMPEKYNPSEKMFLSSGSKGIISIPTFKLSDVIEPTKKEKDILVKLEGKTSLSELVERLTPPEKYNKMDEYDDRKVKTLLLYHIKKMKKKQLIETEIKNRQLFISLTETGDFVRNILKK